jgi:hypothetical protein
MMALVSSDVFDFFRRATDAEQVFEAVLVRDRLVILKILLGYAGDRETAEELAQEVFIRCAVKLRRSGRRYQALTPQGSMRGFLLLNVLSNNGEGGSTRRPGKVTRGPEAATPQGSLDEGIVLRPDQSGRDALETMD